MLVVLQRLLRKVAPSMVRLLPRSDTPMVPASVLVAVWFSNTLLPVMFRKVAHRL